MGNTGLYIYLRHNWLRIRFDVMWSEFLFQICHEIITSLWDITKFIVKSLNKVW